MMLELVRMNAPSCTGLQIEMLPGPFRPRNWRIGKLDVLTEDYGAARDKVDELEAMRRWILLPDGHVLGGQVFGRKQERWSGAVRLLTLQAAPPSAPSTLPPLRQSPSRSPSSPRDAAVVVRRKRNVKAVVGEVLNDVNRYAIALEERRLEHWPRVLRRHQIA